MKRALYTFNWNEGGFNQVWANTKAEAIKEIKREFSNMQCNLTPNLKTLQRRATKASQDEWWAAIPLMD